MSPITGSKSIDVPFTVGVALDGAGWHPAAWREPSSRADALFAAETWVELAETAEAAGLDYLTIADELAPQADPADPANGGSTVLGRLDAALLADWIAPRTSRIGLIPTVTTTHTEPFHVATGLQTLDHVSTGRAGWQLRISADAASAAAFGRRPAPEIDRDAVAFGAPDAGLDELLADAADSAEVARRLWDSWEDDAEIRDAATGRFLDRDRVHPIDFASERFSIAGPSIVPRSPQGQLPVVVLAHSAPVAELAARIADVVIVTPESSSPRAGAWRGRSVAEIVAGIRAIERDPGIAEARTASGLGPLRIVADLVLALDTTGEPAVERLVRLDALAGSPFAASSDARVLAGSADEAAALIAAWRAAGIDGVRLRPLTLPADLRTIGAELLPILRERGIASARTGSAAGSTAAAEPDPTAHHLRTRFGLGRAGNRYATRTETAA
ncbi:hypothetical protein BMH32_09555 [Leucobacter sp. OLJS4]|uniref:LLM class flavin-dependent oxidoreductase n=1 Tax=unclassified Leucobacter TaxID=2621730 RepID=UPI000C174256|nr:MULTISPECIES: LLM class flavin-dependent oxidoreductase [unclassified Leucobacter]PII85022.1 hypothetical protein BMH25_02580 [Leucobacter sp. OLCALW19]PII89032.1 hypothetical protein BMH26_04185 [Leucobacter sp. OLTLW20]PII93559.1 hypothetical protein BMH27_03415 [Leucobacter sp. OLAS13]PII98043.1 hypothetical protein BMH29_09330 [Leucobacter sp. OLDS2]PIJ02659.1 hypothetical protein BMH28_04985 [Leucobacter sp. OLCS4]